MAKKKRGDAHGGGHGWFVTFADLMGLMMSFFVMLVAFSTHGQEQAEDRRRLDARRFRHSDPSRAIPASSNPTAFRRARSSRTSSISARRNSSNTPTPDAQEREHINGAKLKIDREFALASASLRQALQDMPELTEISKHIMFEETKQGLNLEIVDQDGRSMFADGSKVPYERTRRLIEKLAMPAEANAAARSDHRTHRRGLRADAQATMGRSIFRPIAPMWSVRSWNMRVCRHPTSSRSRARPTASRCFPTIRRCRRTGASPSP